MIVRTAIFVMVLLVSKVLMAGSIEQYCNEALPKTTPSERFIIDYEKETVLDTKTELMWKRCLEGSQSGADCGHVSNPLNLPLPRQKVVWKRANEFALSSRHAGYDDWRLPTANELEDIVERTCSDPAINLMVFPGTPRADVWTSSLSASKSFLVTYWYVGFKTGTMNVESRDVRNTVRLVRDARLD